MQIHIPGAEKLSIENVLLDYNGTLALDGRLKAGVAELINSLADNISFHVITADTFGSVQRELEQVNCKVTLIPKENQSQAKLDYLKTLGPEKTMCVGNGRNDLLMLRHSALGIALVQEEGACVQTLLAARVVCHSILDALEFLRNPDRLRATLRN